MQLSEEILAPFINNVINIPMTEIKPQKNYNNDKL